MRVGEEEGVVGKERGDDPVFLVFGYLVRPDELRMDADRAPLFGQGNRAAILTGMVVWYIADLEEDECMHSQLLQPKHISVVDQLYAALRAAIIDNALSPGTRISEAEVAQQYGVSRQPVREAFITLANEGLLEVRPQRGTFIAKISLQAVMDARFVREAVEADIVKLLAQSPDDVLVTKLRAQLLRQEEIIGGSARDFMDADEIFHRTLAEGAGKGKAWRVVVEMKAQMDRVRFLSSMHFPVARLIAQHREVVEAIAVGDASRAEQFMRQHLQGILIDLPVIEQERPEYFL
ncbi:FCD domain protein [Brucella thiophenivorans]|uniref:FCD domain protein n=2 Tax=Brucella thiophenivorans TaxID=571255 RepID=A0A256FBC2_9HYPH|nr:FCD domain protein [Brucella thiophenivorans]